MEEPLRRGREQPPVDAAPPADLVAAPGYGARRMYQAYLAAWNRHVDPVLTGPQFAVLSAIRAYPASDQSSLAGAVALGTFLIALQRQRTLRQRPLPERITPRRQVHFIGTAVLALIVVTTLAQFI